MPKIKLKPEDPPLYYVGIDVTDAIDTVSWGHLWNAHFGWKNLVWELERDPANNQRRVDKDHTLLPIIRQQRQHKDNHYADTCIMPYGENAKGLDPKWPSQTDTSANSTVVSQNCDFIRNFILSPGADKAKSTLNDAGQGVVASVVYISSHGGSTGDMLGEIFYQHIFRLMEAAGHSRQFSGPDWLLLSNCRTLAPTTFDGWITLMNGPKPLRGVVGFQELCPDADGSVDVFAAFINRLVAGKTILEAWSQALRAMGMATRWVVLCHENAQGDTITDWNNRKLKAIVPGSSKMLTFDEANPKGVEVVLKPDPFPAFWSKGIPPTPITVTNRYADANKLAAGDTVTITVKPPATTATFPTGTIIKITLIYIRDNYEQAINVNKMFTVKGQLGTSVPTTAKLNSNRPSSKLGPIDGDDSWILTVDGTPAQVTLTLECIDLDLSKHNQHNVNYFLRVNLSNPFLLQYDTTTNGSILLR